MDKDHAPHENNVSPSEQLGAVCSGLIKMTDSLSMYPSAALPFRIERRKLHDASPVSGLTSSAIDVKGIITEDGRVYDLAIHHSDDDEGTAGIFDIDNPQAFYRMTLRRTEHTPDGPVTVEAMSVEMARGSRRHSGGSTEPTSLIVWDLFNEGEAEYLRGDDIVNSPQFTSFNQVNDVLEAAYESEYAKLLYGN